MKTFVSCARPVCLVASFFVLSMHAAPSSAQVPAFELQPVTVTGSGMPRTLGSEIAATSVLTRSDIERSGARDLVSVLNMLGTALVEQQGGPGTLASVRIRGADSRDTLVLVDGVPLTDVSTGQASLSQIPADVIERVEVVRGNMSALYGANATGGVIQIFTRRGVAGSFLPSVSLGMGSRGTRSLYVSAGGGSEALRAHVSAGAERTNGFSAVDTAAVPGANPDKDGNHRQHATLALDAQMAPEHRLGLDLRVIDGKVAYDSSFDAATDTHTQHLTQTGGTLRGTHLLHPEWTLAWRLASADEKRVEDSVTAFGGASNSINLLHSRELAFDLNGALSPGWGVQVGAGRSLQSTDSSNYMHQRDTDTLRLGSTFDADWGSLQANVRHDETGDFGSATTGLLGGRLVLGRGVSAIASVSTSFTPPKFDFLFYDCSPFVCSNPNLRPEKGRNAEAGLQWEDARTLARVTVFAARYRDKIADDINFVPQNLNRVKNSGLELSLRTHLSAWNVAGEAVFQNPVDEATGQRLIRRARQQFAVRAGYDAGAWGAHTGLRHVGNRVDGVTLPSYTVVDTSLRWMLAPDWTVQGTIENLLDRRYQTAAGYNGIPRGLFISLNWQPKP